MSELTTNDLAWLSKHLEGLLVVLRNSSDLSSGLSRIRELYPDSPSLHTLHKLMTLRLCEVPVYLHPTNLVSPCEEFISETAPCSISYLLRRAPMSLSEREIRETLWAMVEQNKLIIDDEWMIRNVG